MINKDKLIILIFLLGPFFIDQANGLIKEKLNLDISISVYYKFCIYIILIVYIFINDQKKKYSLGILILFLLFIISVFANLITSQTDISTISKDFTFIVKIVILPLTYFAANIYFSNNTKLLNNDQATYNLFTFLLTMLFIAQILTPYGFGLSTYGENKEGEAIGWSGFFISGNELSAFFILIYSLTSFFALYNYHKIKSPLIIVMGIMSGAFLGTKTAILGSFLILFMNYALIKAYNRTLLNITKFDITLIKLLSVGILMGMIFIGKIIELMTPLYNRYVYFSAIKENAVYGSRIERLEPIITEYKDFSLLQQLFGRGFAFAKSRTIGETRFTIAEIDIIDLWYTFGFIGMCAIYGVWIYLFIKTAGYFFYKKDILAIPIAISLIILIMNSVVAGHIMYATLTHIFLGYILGYLYKSFENKQLIKANENSTNF
ncbi:MAG: O-antigen ligase family protein [Sporocytophaga sp.]|uniref:O-antigen ligase family protein n=1 Tax=Sporocytophaga sp. TaxID=2231183 RepID=UPI001B16BB57|nr:O-antigen ligase family protein [Sporocytophaga sp.]MBO9699279.1 O-antigen ligase family protein [Sporocytophaga sp.]